MPINIAPASSSTTMRHRGASLIELLVTVFIISIGMFGLMLLQSRMHTLQFDGDQRTQALVLAQDLAQRMQINRRDIDSYITTTEIGSSACAGGTSTLVLRDQAAWCTALTGGGERIGTSSVGGMLGARGCVEKLDDGNYLISVVWQGTTPSAPPPTGISCAKNNYDTGGDTGCTNDRCRRYVTVLVRKASLS
jgi:type IV pilus assembly protein PilV